MAGTQQDHTVTQSHFFTAEQIAARFHETYERLAPSFSYKTREASAKPWADVPEQNKRLMIAVAREVGEWLGRLDPGQSDLSRFLGQEYPDGTVLVWRTPSFLALAIRDDQSTTGAGLGGAHWWIPSLNRAGTWDDLVALVFAIGEPDHVLQAWAL